MNNQNQNQKFADLIKAAKSEPMYVLTEKDAPILQLLHLLPGNRAMHEDKVKNLVEAFKNDEFVPPILVAVPSRTITEGNHRFAAILRCLAANIPFTLRVITYKDADSLQTARVINNTQTRWTANDRLASYIYEGKEPYIMLKSFMDKYSSIFFTNNYRIMAALTVLAMGRSTMSMRQMYYTGALKLCNDNVRYGDLLLQELIAINAIVEDTAIFLQESIGAWQKVRKILNVSIESFLKHLRKRKNAWRTPGHSMADWFNVYISIASNLQPLK